MELEIQIKQKQAVLRGKNKSRTLFIPKLTGKAEISSIIQSPSGNCNTSKAPAQRQQGWKQSKHALPPTQSQAQGVQPTLQILLQQLLP